MVVLLLTFIRTACWLDKVVSTILSLKRNITKYVGIQCETCDSCCCYCCCCFFIFLFTKVYVFFAWFWWLLWYVVVPEACAAVMPFVFANIILSFLTPGQKTSTGIEQETKIIRQGEFFHAYCTASSFCATSLDMAGLGEAKPWKWNTCFCEVTHWLQRPACWFVFSKPGTSKETPTHPPFSDSSIQEPALHISRFAPMPTTNTNWATTCASTPKRLPSFGPCNSLKAGFGYVWMVKIS